MLAYCKGCADRLGWEFDAAKVGKDRSQCDICSDYGEYSYCIRVEPHKLPNPRSLDGSKSISGLDARGALYDVYAYCRQALKDAYSKVVLAVGERAAREARTQAIRTVGWKPHCTEKILQEELESLDAGVRGAMKTWAEKFVAFQRVYQMCYGKVEKTVTVDLVRMVKRLEGRVASAQEELTRCEKDHPIWLAAKNDLGSNAVPKPPLVQMWEGVLHEAERCLALVKEGIHVA